MNDSSAQVRVVVGVDGSRPSKRALEWARFIARTSGAEVVAVMAWDVSGYVTAAVGWPDGFDPAAAATAELHRIVEEVLGAEPDVQVGQVVREGNTAKVLLDASKDALVLVVGSRGHGGFAGLLMGSVSAACAEHAQCPVLIIHGETPPPPFAV